MSKIYEESKKAGNALSKLAARLTGGITEEIAKSGDSVVARGQNHLNSKIDANPNIDNVTKVSAKIGVGIVGYGTRAILEVARILGKVVKDQGK